MNFFNLNENSPTIKQPQGLEVKLRAHQLTSIAAMRELEKQSNIIIDRPTTNSDLYRTIYYRLNDIEEFVNSTYIIETNVAILADKVGSGKTLMIIGLILSKSIPSIHDRLMVGTDYFSLKMISVKESENVNLIVVPHNLVNQWKDFINKSNLPYISFNQMSDFDIFFDIDYTNEIIYYYDNVFTIYNKSKKKTISNKKAKKVSGSKVSKKKITEIYERKRLNIKKVNKLLRKNSVILLNVNRYSLFKQIFPTRKWARVIIDEMDTIPIPIAFDEFGNFNWFITATPTSILNKSCKRYVNKIFGTYGKLLNYFVVKNEDQYVDQSIVLPKPNIYIIITLLQKTISVIKDMIPYDILQLINAGNVKEAIVKLNCNVDTSDNIVNVLTDKIRIELHNLKKELEYVNGIIPIDFNTHEKKIETLKNNIDRCKTKLKTIKNRIDSIKDECCIICADIYDTPTIVDCCKHVFCLKCLLSALKISDNKCPYCRYILKSNKEYHIIDNKNKLNDKKVIKKSIKNTDKKFCDLDKADVLEHILRYISKNDKSPRILIFSDYSQTFEKIIANILRVKLEYKNISGTPSHITNIIDDFNNGNINVLLMNSQHYGSGLNLQAANYLILYHRMTSELETQVIGRAHRFGRKYPVNIIYLVNSSENHDINLSDNPYMINSEDELCKMIKISENNIIGKKK
uniref:RING-type domain-containing protein n=1 Tax=viral metagenome TaxID=1070528 RepID=A0A6C0LQW1_9ZZZZ